MGNSWRDPDEQDKRRERMTQLLEWKVFNPTKAEERWSRIFAGLIMGSVALFILAVIAKLIWLVIT